MSYAEEPDKPARIGTSNQEISAVASEGSKKLGEPTGPEELPLSWNRQFTTRIGKLVNPEARDADASGQPALQLALKADQEPQQESQLGESQPQQDSDPKVHVVVPPNENLSREINITINLNTPMRSEIGDAEKTVSDDSAKPDPAPALSVAPPTASKEASGQMVFFDARPERLSLAPPKNELTSYELKQELSLNAPTSTRSQSSRFRRLSRVSSEPTVSPAPTGTVQPLPVPHLSRAPQLPPSSPLPTAPQLRKEFKTPTAPQLTKVAPVQTESQLPIPKTSIPKTSIPTTRYPRPIDLAKTYQPVGRAVQPVVQPNVQTATQSAAQPVRKDESVESRVAATDTNGSIKTNGFVHDPAVVRYAGGNPNSHAAQQGMSAAQLANHSKPIAPTAAGQSAPAGIRSGVAFQNEVVRMGMDALYHAEEADERGTPLLARSFLMRALDRFAEASHRPGQPRSGSLSLEAAMTALRECADFGRFGDLDSSAISRLVNSHQTPVLKGYNLSNVPRSQAQRAYYDFAEKHLINALKPIPNASRALVLLAKTEPFAFRDAKETIAKNQACLLRAALACDSRNWEARNALAGVLIKFGLLDESRRLLEANYTMNPAPETLQLLAVANRKIGNHQAALEYENRFAAEQSRGKKGVVVNLSPQQFAQYSGQQIGSGNVPVTAASVEQPNTGQVRSPGQIDLTPASWTKRAANRMTKPIRNLFQ